MRFASWTYTAAEVDLHPKQIVVDVTNYLRGGIWDLVDARIDRIAYQMHQYASVDEVSPRVDILVTIVSRENLDRGLNHFRVDKSIQRLSS